jgi:hypothetical protein
MGFESNLFMKLLFILLVVLNGVLSYFSFLREDTRTINAEFTDQTHQLYLINEQKTADSEKDRSQIKDKPEKAEFEESVNSGISVAETKPLTNGQNKQHSQEVNTICLKVSSILDAEQNSFLNDNKVFSLHSTGSEPYVKQRYWVHIPQYNNKEEAINAQAKLFAMDIKDSFIVKRGENINAISLGLFSTDDSAKKVMHRVNKTRAITKKATIEIIELTSERAWRMYQVLTDNRDKAEQLLREHKLSMEWQKCKDTR